jgi:hypothetical protein
METPIDSLEVTMMRKQRDVINRRVVDALFAVRGRSSAIPSRCHSECKSRDRTTMTRLYKHLRVHQLFGANTDVGKTLLTTALCRASALRQKRVFYLKPVSTGPPADADDGSVFKLFRCSV